MCDWYHCKETFQHILSTWRMIITSAPSNSSTTPWESQLAHRHVLGPYSSCWCSNRVCSANWFTVFFGAVNWTTQVLYSLRLESHRQRVVFNMCLLSRTDNEEKSICICRLKWGEKQEEVLRTWAQFKQVYALGQLCETVQGEYWVRLVLTSRITLVDPKWFMHIETVNFGKFGNLTLNVYDREGTLRDDNWLVGDQFLIEN